MFGITPSARLRPSPYYEATLKEGVTAFTTYNHMLMPTSYGHPEDEYWRLINGASQWDVAVERQVQLQGPDAGRLAQILCTRDLSRCQVGQGKYVAVCNHDGVLINDPILLKLDDERYWLSIADSNIWFWARAIAAERGLKVTVSEPDVSPLAVQGPKGEDVVAAIFGDWLRGLKYFWFKETSIDGIQVAVVVAVLVAVVTEMVSGGGGLGYMMIRAYRYGDVRTAFAALVTISLVGLVLYHGAQAVRTRLLFWHVSDTQT